MKTGSRTERHHVVSKSDELPAAEEVQELIHEFWPERPPIPIGSCATVAVAIDVVRRHQAAEQAKKHALTGEGIRKRPRPILGDKGKKYGRYFLRFLREARSRLTDDMRKFVDDLEHDPVMREYFGHVPEMLAAMKAAEAHVDAFLKLCADYDDHEIKSARRNPALFIAKKLEYAWCNEHSFNQSVGDFPRDRGPQTPLCGFTQRALCLAKIHLSLDYVSDMLRERTQRPRSGKARAPGRKL